MASPVEIKTHIIPRSLFTYPIKAIKECFQAPKLNVHASLDSISGFYHSDSVKIVPTTPVQAEATLVNMRESYTNNDYSVYLKDKKA